AAGGDGDRGRSRAARRRPHARRDRALRAAGSRALRQAGGDGTAAGGGLRHRPAARARLDVSRRGDPHALPVGNRPADQPARPAPGGDEFPRALSVKLMELLAVLPGAQVAGASGTDTEILRIEHDSRRVRPGDLFVAIRGEKFDGRAHAAEAARRGAVAIVSDREPLPGLPDVPRVTFDRPRLALARLAAKLAGNPAARLVLAGVPGPNGKTTTTTLIAALFEAPFGASGFLGTIGYRAGRKQLEAPRTTPEAPVIQELLAEMVREKIPAAAMEVSSHALALERVEGCRFDAAVFTNRTPEHLDFHRAMEAYYPPTRMLFGLRKPAEPAIVNADDPSGARMAAEIAAPVVTFSARGLPATVVAGNVSSDLSGTTLDAIGPHRPPPLPPPTIRPLPPPHHPPPP